MSKLNHMVIVQEDKDGLNQFVGSAVRRFRQKRKLSQKKLSKKIGLTQPKISRIETGKVEASASELFTISRVLRFDANEVFLDYQSQSVS
jgi:transcriptional regulator with XRE-family HTH domain